MKLSISAPLYGYANCNAVGILAMSKKIYFKKWKENFFYRWKKALKINFIKMFVD